MTRVLLVDDDPGIQELYGRLLRDEGYEVYQADSAENATEFLITRPFDLVLLDIRIPHLDGIVIKEIFETYDPHLKVIVSSVYPLAEQRRRIPNAADYFDKSHGTELLLETIRRVLENSTEDFEI